MLNLTIIAGSGRVNSQSVKVGRYLLERATEFGFAEGNRHLIDLGAEPLAQWPSETPDSRWEQYAEQLTIADALIVIAPEWHGMAAPALKNFFLYTLAQQVGHKPALLPRRRLPD